MYAHAISCHFFTRIIPLTLHIFLAYSDKDLFLNFHFLLLNYQ